MMERVIGEFVWALASALHTFAKWIFSFESTAYGAIIIGTFVAAFAGAYGAQWIAEQRRLKEELLKEIRNSNAAVTYAFTIGNLALALKEQMGKPLKENFDRTKADYFAFEELRTEGLVGQGETFTFVSDFRTMPTQLYPLEPLSDILNGKLSLAGRAISAFSVLSQSLNDLNEAINQRNRLVGLFMSKSPIPIGELLPRYFGIPDENGNVDQTYPDTIEAITHHLDNCIFYSDLVCKDLVDHVESLRKRYGRGAPKAHKSDFTKAEKAGLMPNPEDFKNWTSAFVVASKKKRSGREEQ